MKGTEIQRKAIIGDAAITKNSNISTITANAVTFDKLRDIPSPS